MKYMKLLHIGKRFDILGKNEKKGVDIFFKWYYNIYELICPMVEVSFVIKGNSKLFRYKCFFDVAIVLPKNEEVVMTHSICDNISVVIIIFT